MGEKIYLASNLKYLRIQKGKTQEQIASICNKKNTAISNWEKGIREPEALDLITLSRYFNISVDDLVSKDLKKEQPSKNFSYNFLEKQAKKNLNDLNNAQSILNELPSEIYSFLDLDFEYSVLLDIEKKYGLYNYSNFIELYNLLIENGYIIRGKELNKNDIKRIVIYIRENKNELLKKLNFKKKDITDKINIFKETPFYEKHIKEENEINEAISELRKQDD